MPPSRQQSKDESKIAQNYCPGILLFSTSMKLMWADRRAWELCKRLGVKKDGRSPGLLPEPILEVGARVMRALKDNPGVKDWEQFQNRRVIRESGKPVLLCGYGIPDQARPAQSRILVVAQELGFQEDAALEQAKEMYRFSDRETAVVRRLLKGWSNKQIAYELRLTEQTVKEHVTRIMKKTRNGSRTGILLRVLSV